MRVSLAVTNSSWPGGPTAIRAELVGVARAAEDGGLDTVWVSDHLLQADPSSRLTPRCSRTRSTIRSRPPRRTRRSWSAASASAGRSPSSRAARTPATSSTSRTGGATIRRKLEVLRRLCDEAGRPYEAIEKTVSTRLEPDEPADAFAGRCARLAELGIEHAVVITPGPWSPEAVGRLAGARARLVR